MKKYGLKISKKKDPNAYKFGASLPIEILEPFGDWSNYLPVKEFQNLNNIEPYACVPFTILNCVETLIKRQYGEERNWSDRFLSYVTDTSDGGSDPHECAEFLRKLGVPPQENWPFDSSINTTEKFFARPEPKIYEIAREFLEEFDFKHEDVERKHEAISEALKCSPLLISVYAWKRNTDGLYIKPSGARDVHATTMFQERVGEFRRVFDSYDAPHIKDYDWNAMPEVIKRFWIKKRPVYEEKLNILQRIIAVLAQLIGLMYKSPQPPITPIVEPPQPKYLWDTPVLARHSVRVIADEEKLTVGQKNTMCATIGAESGWNPKAVNYNKKNGKIVSTDYGICQWNDYYHGKEISPDEALNNPEKAVRLMCTYWKRGQRNLWIGYINGSYKKFL